jgi:hypothetical protein
LEVDFARTSAFDLGPKHALLILWLFPMKERPFKTRKQYHR